MIEKDEWIDGETGTLSLLNSKKKKKKNHRFASKLLRCSSTLLLCYFLLNFKL